MTNSFKWRLILSYITLILFFVLVVGLVLVRSIDSFYMDNLKQHLIYEAQLIAELSRNYDFSRGTTEMSQLAFMASKDTRARVTIVAVDGTVLADSREDSRKMENHANRPEIRSALNGEVRSTTRYSSTLKTDMMYVAVPVTRGGQVNGAVRLSLPLTAINSLLRRLWTVVFTIMAVAALLSGLLSLKFVNTLTRPLSNMTEVARSMAAGNLKRRVHYDKNDEIGVLAGAINTMAHNLDETISEISEIKSRLETVLENTVNGIIFISAENQILFINPAARELLGVQNINVEGKRDIELIHSYALAQCVDQVIRERKPIKQEFVLHSAGNKTVEGNIVPIENSAGFQGVLVVLNDISELKRLETIRRDFVANVSHELKTPVAAISGFAETLMVENPENQTVQEFSRIIYEEATRLARLVSGLLELSRLESVEVNLTLEDFDMRDCIRSTLTRYERQLAEKRLAMDLQLPDEKVMVKADWDRMHQVLLNLLDNAVSHSQEGATITVALADRISDVLVSVVDQGPGIPEEETERIFERFYRVDKARTRKDGGTGLGLSIVKHIVRAHGGHVGVDSVPGKGSNFYFTIPRKH